MTPHETVGQSQFYLMRGRIPYCKLNPGWMRRSRIVDCEVENGKSCIKSSQEKDKVYLDARNKVKEVDLKEGQWVRVKSGRKVIKGESCFGDPRKIIKVMKNTVKLDDGSIYHMSRLAIVKHDTSGGVSQEKQNSADKMRRYWWLELTDDGRGVVGQGVK